MIRLKHFGNGECESIHGCFRKFGQELDMPEQAALDMLLAGGGLLTVEQFASCEFTPLEKTNRHERKGPAYMERHQKALRLRLELIEQLTAAVNEAV